MFLALSTVYNLPPGLNSAVCWVESSHRVNVVHRDDGGHNSVGICQIQLPTARFLGFKGSEADLYQTDTNLRLSSAYLRYQLLRYRGDVGKAISAYNMGHYKLNAQGIVANKSYVDKVMKARKERR